jgi:hypothetical protein
MEWHLERSRIIFAIEHEMSREERNSTENKYWSLIDGKRYLQVMVEERDHFRTRKTPNATYTSSSAALNTSGSKPATVEDEKKD